MAMVMGGFCLDLRTLTFMFSRNKIRLLMRFLLKYYLADQSDISRLGFEHIHRQKNLALETCGLESVFHHRPRRERL